MLSTDTNRHVAEVQALRQRVSELEKSQLEYERMGKALKESEGKYKTAFESANDVLILLDKKGKILDVNKKLTDVGGYDKVELVGKRITSLTKMMSKKSIAVVAKNFVKRIVGIEIPPYEVEMIKKSGELMNVEINAVAVRKDGRIVGDLAILRDVTESRRTEKVLRESEEKYRDLFENTNDLIQSVTPEGRFRYVNSAWRKTLGYSEEEVSDLTIFSIVHPDYLEHYQLLFQKIMSGKDVGQVDTVFVTKNGEKVVVDGNINCRFMGGKPMYTRAIFRDITERKHVEEEVIRLANAIRMSSDSIIISDLESKITDVNQATLEMYGAESKEDLIGKNFLELVVSEWRGTVLEDIREVQDSGYVKGQEYHIISKDSREVPVEMSSALVKDAEGKLIGFIRVGRDLSERKRVEELYRTLADSSPVGVYIVQNGKFQLVNPRFQKDTGYTENELLGVDSLDIVLPEDRNVVRENAIRMLKGERSEPYEYRSIMRGGDVRWAIETVTSIYYKGERATLGNYIDITERKQAEEREGQLQQSPV